MNETTLKVFHVVSCFHPYRTGGVYTSQRWSKVIPSKLRGLYKYTEINYNASMKKEDAIKLAGSAIKLAKVLGITKGAVSHWKDTIPKGREYELRYLKPEWFVVQKEAA